MADDELEAIRAKRMAELQQQMVRMTLHGFEANVLL
jgi:DNA-binding TFAR19-related protein (PDSD5 family)